MQIGPFDRLRLTRSRERDTRRRFAHAAHLLKQFKPGGRQHEPAADTLEQHNPKLPFQRIDLSAERRLGQPKRARRRRERAFLGRHKKRPRLIPIELY